MVIIPCQLRFAFVVVEQFHAINNHIIEGVEAMDADVIDPWRRTKINNPNLPKSKLHAICNLVLHNLTRRMV